MPIECKCGNFQSWDCEDGDYFGYCLEHDEDEMNFDAWCDKHRMDWDKQEKLRK